MDKEPLKNSPDHKKGERSFQLCLTHPQLFMDERRKFNAALDAVAEQFDFIRYGASNTSSSYIIKEDNKKKALAALDAMGQVLCEQVEYGSIDLVDWIRRPYVLEIGLIKSNRDDEELLLQVLQKYSGDIYLSRPENHNTTHYQLLFSEPSGGNKELANNAQVEIRQMFKGYVSMRNDLFPSDHPILNLTRQDLMAKRLSTQTNAGIARPKIKV